MGLLGNLFGKQKDGQGIRMSFSFSTQASPEEALLEQLEEELELLQEEQEALEELLEDLDYDPPEEGSSADRRSRARRGLYEAQLDELQREMESLSRRIEALEDDFA